MDFNGEMGTLFHLGLTNSQAKVYLALLRMGADCKGTTIAQFANVPRQDVYRLLAELEQIGIVTRTLARPTKYRATCAKEAIEILLNRKKADFSKLRREGTIFIKKAEESLVPRTFSEDEVAIISGREALTSKVREASLRTQIVYRGIIPFNELMPWLSIVPADEALSRGVEFRLITDETAGVNRLPALLQRNFDFPNFKLRLTPNPVRVKLSLFDHKEVITAMFTDFNFAVSPALYSNNPAITAMAESYFETCWENAEEVDPETLSRPHLKQKE